MTAICRVGDLKPGMGAYDERLGREAAPFPYGVNDEVSVDGLT